VAAQGDTPTPVLAIQVDDVYVPRQRAGATVADLAIAGLYVPAGVGPEPVAGDFFEVLPLGDDVVALLVGDVAGHGRSAVGKMRELRAAARVYALERRGPTSVLAKLDEFMERGDEEGFATLWYGEYRSGTGTLTYASAGHPPPAVHTHAGVVLLAEADAPSLGSGLGHDLALERTLTLPPGAIVVAYSDGLFERRGTDLDRQLALVVDVVTRACDPARAGTPQTIAAEILATLLPDPNRAEDDVCLLVVRRMP
jgi:serine phosphatase RsbU (regulator of sigma subunit)